MFWWVLIYDYICIGSRPDVSKTKGLKYSYGELDESDDPD